MEEKKKPTIVTGVLNDDVMTAEETKNAFEAAVEPNEAPVPEAPAKESEK